jgi:hypothetical protein
MGKVLFVGEGRLWSRPGGYYAETGIYLGCEVFYPPCVKYGFGGENFQTSLEDEAKLHGAGYG